MTVAKVVKTAASGAQNKKYISLAGTAAELLQALADEHIKKEQIVEMKNDATFVVYALG